jgi:hypothetical protein
MDKSWKCIGPTFGLVGVGVVIGVGVGIGRFKNHL